MIVRHRYYNKVRNLGDAITAPLLDRILGLVPVTVPRMHPHLLATGSIFFMANENSHIWGSGILDPAMNLDKVDPSKIHAVRGYETLKILRRRFSGLGDLPFGDPGILIDRLVPEHRWKTTIHEAAVVPNHASFEHRAFDRFRANKEITLVDMRGASLEALEQIAASRTVISQSLHGLVFATALGKPSVWISHLFDDRWTFKFKDWFSTVAEPQIDPVPLLAPLPEMLGAARFRNSLIDQSALLEAFPRSEVCVPNERIVMDFASVRRLGLAVFSLDWASFGEGRASDWRSEKAVRDALAKRVNRLFDEHFRDWAERPYILLLPTGAAIDEGRRGAISRFMDAHPQIDMLLVASDSDRMNVTGDNDFSCEALRVFAGPRVRSGALLVRPNAPFSLERRIDTCMFL